MRIACVLIRHFAAAVAEQQRPDLAGRPLIIGGNPHERRLVYDVSPAARHYGVVAGMTLREASQRCPQAVFLPGDEVAYQRTFETMQVAMAEFTSAVEGGEPGCLYLDLRDIALPNGGELELGAELARATHASVGLSPAVGLAGNKFVARLAALDAGAGEVRLIPPGGEKVFLAPLPISLLPLSHETLRRLRLLGLTSAGALAGLPTRAVAEQLGAEGALAHRLANGLGEQAIIPRRPSLILEETRAFDEPLASQEVLAFTLAHLVDQILPRLLCERLFCRKVEVMARLADQECIEASTYLREPSQEGEVIVRAAFRLLSERCHAGVVAIKLALAELGEANVQQLSLFAPHQGKRKKIADASAKLQAKIGDGRLRKAVILDAKALLPERRFALVEYR